MFSWQFYVSENSSSKLADKVSELHDWLQPLDKVPSFLHEASVVNQLVTQMNALAEDVTSLPAGLVTVLRVLRHLAIDPYPEKEGWSLWFCTRLFASEVLHESKFLFL